MHPNRWKRAFLGATLLCAMAGGFGKPLSVWAQAPQARPWATANPQPAQGPAYPTYPPGPGGVLEGPTLSETAPNPSIAPPRPAPEDRPLPINLATALQLSNARPLVIAFAQARVAEAAAVLQGANVLWLPNINFGIDYQRHDGADQSTDGTVIFPSKKRLDRWRGGDGHLERLRRHLPPAGRPAGTPLAAMGRPDGLQRRPARRGPGLLRRAAGPGATGGFHGGRGQGGGTGRHGPRALEGPGGRDRSRSRPVGASRRAAGSRGPPVRLAR